MRLLAIARALIATGEAPTAEAVAAAAGVSRSTYYRLAGGSHEALLREAGWVEEPSARERLIDAAADLLGEVGLSGLVMDAVAERAGLSHATLYRLFPGKTELITAIAKARAPLARLGPALAALGDRSPEEVLPALAVAAVPQLLASRGVLRTVLAEATMSGSESAEGRAAVASAYADVAAYLEKQMQAGRLRREDPLVAVQALMGPILLYTVARPDFWASVTAAPLPPAEVIARLVQLWLRGMRPDTSGA